MTEGFLFCWGFVVALMSVAVAIAGALLVIRLYTTWSYKRDKHNHCSKGH